MANKTPTTTIWLQPNKPSSTPVEVEYPSKKATQLMVAGHRQCAAPASASVPASAPVHDSPASPSSAPSPSSPHSGAAPQPLPSLGPKIWLKPPNGGAAIEVEELPDIVTPFLNEGYTEVPAP